MNRDILVRIGVLALVLALGTWVALSTEWVDEPSERPPQGEAARNRWFAAEQVLRQLGATVHRPKSLEPLPPPGARLLLSSPHWQLFPERSAQLRQWVEAGGHLVIPATQVTQSSWKGWLPVVLHDPDEEEDDEDDRPGKPAPPPKPKPTAKPRASSGPLDPDRYCRQLAAPPGPDGAIASLRVCAVAFWRALEPRANAGTPQWTLQGPRGTELLRMPLGRGSVTAYGPWTLTQNSELLRADHALALASALQLEPGAVVWLVTEEARPGLLPWLWTSAWTAILLALAALALWVWRSCVRFGPVGAATPLQRRSMREQVAGTAAFLRQHGTAALHAAQLRALLETARARLPGFAGLDGAAAGPAIAKATAFDAADLARAMQPGARSPDRLPADLELLEAARRRLDAAHPPSRSS